MAPSLSISLALRHSTIIFKLQDSPRSHPQDEWAMWQWIWQSVRQNPNPLSKEGSGNEWWNPPVNTFRRDETNLNFGMHFECNLLTNRLHCVLIKRSDLLRIGGSEAPPVAYNLCLFNGQPVAAGGWTPFFRGRKKWENAAAPAKIIPSLWPMSCATANGTWHSQLAMSAS